MNDHIERTKRMIEVMQAYVDGHTVQAKTGTGRFLSDDRLWQDCEMPFCALDPDHYRIKTAL